jgi:hypothetical protein
MTKRSESTHPSRFDRREALRIAGQYAAVTSVAVWGIGCESKPKLPPPVVEKKPVPPPPEAPAKVAAAPVGNAGEGGLNCDNAAQIDATSKSLREGFKYVEKSVEAGKNCTGCLLYNAPVKEGECGGCKLFTGPVNPNGYCLSFAPKKPA